MFQSTDQFERGTKMILTIDVEESDTFDEDGEIKNASDGGRTTDDGGFRN